MPSRFTEDEWSVLLGHLGYGNPAGPLWFMGMEEGLGGERDANLRWRLDHFAHPVDTLTNHLKASWINGKMPQTPTWRIMSKLTRMLVDGATDWSDRESALRYAMKRLGTADGSTFLLELLPLPNRSMKEWSHQDRFPGGRPQYMREVLPERIRVLRAFAEEHKPRCVICYGKAFWGYYQQVFPLPDLRIHSLSGADVGVGHWGETTVLLTPFFTPYAFPERTMASLPSLVRGRA